MVLGDQLHGGAPSNGDHVEGAVDHRLVDKGCQSGDDGISEEADGEELVIGDPRTLKEDDGVLEAVNTLGQEQDG
jgi:hypothetical protein